MRFINFCDETENGYLNIDTIKTCFIQHEKDKLYSLKLVFEDSTSFANRTIGIFDNYTTIIKKQIMLISFLTNDRIKIIDIDDKGKVSPRFHV